MRPGPYSRSQPTNHCHRHGCGHLASQHAKPDRWCCFGACQVAGCACTWYSQNQGRPRLYETNADRQRAYRQRKRAAQP